MTAEIVFIRDKHLGVVTLNRPQALNALTLDMVKAFYQQLQNWQHDDAIHAVLITAVTSKAFCAGGDVRWLYETGHQKNPEQLQFFGHEYRLNYLLHTYPKPVIALMDGITMGGGAGISLHGSHPIASENFVFAMPEAAIGFFPDIGASYFLTRCPDYFGYYLGLTGQKARADDALMLGLVKYVIAAEKFPEVYDSLLHANLTSNAHRQVSLCLDQFATPPKKSLFAEINEEINTYFCFRHMEQIIDALDNATTVFAKQTREILARQAPLSLKVIMAQLHRASRLTLAECLHMDYVLVQHFMRGHDFYEGVRALLVDKDKQPNWQPANLSEVTNEMVEDYFCSSELRTLNV